MRRSDPVDGPPVEEGESSLALTPQSGETAPLYGWDVRPPQVQDFADDVGIWRIRSDAVQFRSHDGLGTYTATPEPVTDGRFGGPRLTVHARTGRLYTFRRVRSASLSTAEALFEIAVDDPAGRCAPGAYLRIRAPDGVVSPAVTTEFGPFPMGGPAGEWTVTVTPPTGYVLAPGQANPLLSRPRRRRGRSCASRCAGASKLSGRRDVAR